MRAGGRCRRRARAAAAVASLNDLLEVHAPAEQAVPCPAAMAAERYGGGEQTKDAVHRHNGIRDHTGHVAEHQPGTSLLSPAARQVHAANDYHIAEEETRQLHGFSRAMTDAYLEKHR